MDQLDISVLMATSNRAAGLRRTLESFERLDRQGRRVEIVVIDNGSHDNTLEVLEAFVERLPLRFLQDSVPGKNRALNRALDEVPLGRIVVFTDDDVDPAPDWFEAILSAADRWPDASVFGGRIQVVWPRPQVPDWAHDPYIMDVGFAAHDLGGEERPYADRGVPVGPNFWIRRELVDSGLRFDEDIGPRPENRKMGGETEFLMRLRQLGHVPIYCPGACVGHRIQPELLTTVGIRRRAWRSGRGSLHVRGIPRRELLERSRWSWYLVRLGAMARLMAKIGAACLSFSAAGRVRRWFPRVRDLGYNVEAIRLAGSKGAEDAEVR